MLRLLFLRLDGMKLFGLVVAEMKSYGIPCIVPDRCAASEQIEEGKTGYIFESGNLESLKECICKYEQTDIIKLQNNILDISTSQKIFNGGAY